MTRTQINAAIAMGNRTKVEAGSTPEDYDTGWIVRWLGETTVEVSWDSGCAPSAPIDALAIL